MEKKKENKKDKDAVDIKIAKKKGKIFGINDIPYSDAQIGFGWTDNNMLTEELANEKKKLEEGLNKKNGRDMIIFLRRLTKGDKTTYIKSLEEMVLSIFKNLQLMESLCDHATTWLNEYREILDRLPERIKSIALEKKEIDIIKGLKKDMGEIIKPESREKCIAERPTPEQIKRIKILYFEQNFPELFMKELEKTEKMTDNEYVAYREQQRKEFIKGKRNLMDDLLKKRGK